MEKSAHNGESARTWTAYGSKKARPIHNAEPSKRVRKNLPFILIFPPLQFQLHIVCT